MAYFGTAGSWSSILFSFAVPIVLPAAVEFGLPRLLPQLINLPSDSFEQFARLASTIGTVMGLALVIRQRQLERATPLVFRNSFEHIGKRAESLASRLGLDAHIKGLNIGTLAKGVLGAYGVPVGALEDAAKEAKRKRKPEA